MVCHVVADGVAWRHGLLPGRHAQLGFTLAVLCPDSQPSHTARPQVSNRCRALASPQAATWSPVQPPVSSLESPGFTPLGLNMIGINQWEAILLLGIAAVVV